MDRITVTPDELRTTFRVWLQTIPPRIWRELEKQERLDAEKRGGSIRFDARAALADYMADKFNQGRWEASYPRPTPYVDRGRAL